MPLLGARPRARLFRLGGIILALSIVLSACAEDERREIRLTPTSTVETGVRVLADNCPGPETVTLSVRDEVLWEIGRIPVIEDEEATTQPTQPDPGLVEFLVGRTPEGWQAELELTEPLVPGIRYTIRTQPDEQTIDFSTPDLSPGLLWDGAGNAQFNPDLIQVECSEPADLEGFAQNIVVLIALWVTAAAGVMVALILLLFVITRRFSRVISVQKKAEREAQKDLR